MTPSRWQQIEVVYHAALEKRPEQRDAFLGEACANDAELRREVESLLAQDPSSANALDRPAWEGQPGVLSGVATVTVLTPGMQLGPHKLEGLLGKGGIGEVFRARDTRLGRSVAIKVSQAQFSERFEREARAISALNHPHICTLYDVGPNYLVMELVEGETLAARLKKGPLSIEQTLQYGAQIADALAAAHAKAITHRDLKPGNIMISKSSGVKALDFGLAKMHGDVLTQSNVVMGTPAYMAPEQLEGQEADARSDIYSLGLVLYESVTRQRAVQGRVPPLESVPERLAHVIERCLAVEPEERWQSARDVAKELAWAGTRIETPARTKIRWGLPAWGWASGFAAAGVALGWWLASLISQLPPETKSLRLDLTPPPGTEFQTDRGAAIAPDGTAVVFASRSQQSEKLWMRSLATGETRELPGTDGATFPFWSPDSRSVAFFGGGKLQRVDLSGDVLSVICDGVNGRGGAWNQDGIIIFNAVNDGPLMRISAAGGKPEPLSRIDPSRKENSHRWPQFLPSGKRFLYFVRSDDPDVSGMYLTSLDRPQEHVQILRNRTNAVYAATPESGHGSLFWVQDGNLMRQSFDSTGLKVYGSVELVARGVAPDTVGARLCYVWVSSNGTLLYATDPGRRYQLTWHDRDGWLVGTVGQPEPYEGIRLAPDGTRAVTERQGYLWQIDLARGVESRMAAGALSMAWSPDGTQIATNGSTPPNLFLEDTGAAPKSERVTQSPDSQSVSDWSADGRFLLFQSRANDIATRSQYDLWFLPLTGDRHPMPYLRTSYNEMRGMFSPDGRWVAYISDESGRSEIYVQSFPAGKAKWRVSTRGGDYARWRKDGKELFYLTLDNKIMAVPVVAEGVGLEFGSPAFLFGLTAAGFRGVGRFVDPFDVAPDGKRFLTFDPTVETKPGMAVITNWQPAAKQ